MAMNFYASNPGPTRSEAINLKKQKYTSFPNNIKREYNLQNTPTNILNEILSDTIIYSVNDVYKGTCPTARHYSTFASQAIDNKIEATLPLFVREYLKKKNSAEQRLAFARVLKNASNKPNVNVVRKIGNTHLTLGKDPHVEILKRREARINKMISNRENRQTIMNTITSLKTYYNKKNPSKYNIQRALNKFKEYGYNIVEGGKSKKYIQLQSGGKRLIRYGKKGGKYYMKGGNKIYIN